MNFLGKIRSLIPPSLLPRPPRASKAELRSSIPFIQIRNKRRLIIGLTILLVFFPLFGSGAVTTPSGVETDPLNLDPQVREAFQRFHILDYDGALSRFEKVQTQNPDNPLAVDYVLDTVIFRELYRLDLLDTTFYAHDGFLTGKHAVARDPAVAAAS